MHKGNQLGLERREKFRKKNSGMIDRSDLRVKEFSTHQLRRLLSGEVQNNIKYF